MPHEEREVVVLVPAVSSNRGQWRLRLWGVITLGAATAIAGIGFSGAQAVPIGVLVGLGVTLIAAEHRDRLFGDETSVSGSIVVAMAAVVALSKGPWLAGPMVCAALAGLYWPHIRTFAFSRVAINAAAMSLAAGAAAFVFHAMGGGTHTIGLRFVGAGVLALLGFWLVNSTVLGVAVAVIQGRKWWTVSLDLVRSDLSLLPFAMFGLVSGYLIQRTAFWIGWLTLLSTLVLVDLIVIHRNARRFKSYVRPLAVLLAATVALVLASMGRPSVSYSLLVIVVLAVVGVVVLDRVRPGFGYQTEVVCLVCAAVVFHRGAPLFAPLAVGLATCLALAVWGRGPRSILDIASRTALAALAVGFAGGVLPPSLDGSVDGSLVIGLAGGLAALLGQHAVPGLSLIVRAGRDSWRSATDLLRVDVGLLVAAALGGALCGWTVRRTGLAGLAVSLCVIELATAVVALRRPSKSARVGLNDAALEDVVRSALLDLPASRLPDDL